jgi:hypothetical protein
MAVNVRIAMLIVGVVLSTPLYATETDSTAYVHREYQIDTVIFSYEHGKELESYKSLGSGMATARASLGFAETIKGKSVMVNILPRVKEERFVVTVDLEPEDAKKALGFEKQTHDATDLKPFAVMLPTSEKDRVCQLNITPSIQVADFKPKDLRVNELELYNWRFPDSPIHVNDSIYVGRLSCAQSPVAFVDISGVAKVEFSLRHLSGAKPWGALNNGIVTLTNPEEHTTIQIANVRNGGPVDIDLPGGPYRVWVRWSKASHTVEEYRKELIELRKQIVAGKVPGASVEMLDQQLARPAGPWLYSGGVHGLERGDLEREKK